MRTAGSATMVPVGIAGAMPGRGFGMAPVGDVQTATAWEEVADALPGEVVLVHGTRRVTWAELDERAARASAALVAAGLRPGDRVGIDLYNCPEWVEVFFAVLKARMVPVSINYRYVERELEDLLRYVGLRALVHHASMGERVAEAVEAVGGVELVATVRDDDGGATGAGADVPPPVHAVAYDDLLAAHAPAPRQARAAQDHVMAFTGGTTGLPRGVLYFADAESQVGALRRLTHLTDEAAAPLAPEVGFAERARTLRGRGDHIVAVPCSPLMHATAVGAMHAALHSGGTLVTMPGRRFDPLALLDAVDAEHVTSLLLVGDAFARPMCDALDDAAAAGVPRRAASLRVVSSAGLMFSASVKARLLAHLPHVAIVDACGSAEGAHYGTSTTRAGDDPTSARFVASPGLLVLDGAGEPLLGGGDREGLLASPVGTAGYYDDPVKTAQVFRTIGGRSYVVPGDHGVLHDDGTVTLLGRGTSVVNTGGEKVHPEEVEDVVRAQPEVLDCIVVGTPDHRFGQVVSAVVSWRPGASLPTDELAERCRAVLAPYKVPRRWAVVDEVHRLPNGKPDFPSARAAFVEAAAPDGARSHP